MTGTRGRTARLRPIMSVLLSAVAVVWMLCAFEAGFGWVCDLLANALAWSLVFPVVAVVLLLPGPKPLRRVVMFVSVLQIVTAVWWLQAGRAARAPAGATGSALRVVQGNAKTGGATPEAVLGLLRDCGADVVALTEVSGEVLDRLRADPEMWVRYPHRDVPPWQLSNTRLILSKWPIEPLIVRPELEKDDPRRAIRLVRVLHEDGSFAVLLMHPRSPRSPGRWAAGNEMVEVAIEAARERASGEPLVVLADLNATPTGWRSRRLSSVLGLSRCKPALALDGTYPAGLPWPFRMAIDDAWVSGEWRVTSWKTVELPGSDHRAVEVDLQR